MLLLGFTEAVDDAVCVACLGARVDEGFLVDEAIGVGLAARAVEDLTEAAVLLGVAGTDEPKPEGGESGSERGRESGESDRKKKSEEEGE